MPSSVLPPALTPPRSRRRITGSMKKLHPDHRGSDYLAQKINRARDVLLQQ
jgi:hypothetical protein